MSFLINVLNLLLIFVSLVLIGLVLIQRGKGGGLAGAFGGAGGSSAFGTKAGDIFTRITIGLAGVWILLCMMLVMLANKHQGTSAFADINSSAVDVDRNTEEKNDLGTDKGSKGDEKAPGATPPPVTKDSGLPDAITDEPAEKPDAKTSSDTPKPQP